MATTRSRPRAREYARQASGGAAAEHAAKIWTAAVSVVVVIVAFLALTSTGHVIDAATQHFMLYYAGVFALIALCASTGLGLVATDRVFMNPGHRVLAQAAHRAASFGAVAFLIVHIVTEILAQRVHMLDAVVPFLSPFRTFYTGLGTIASDLVILLVITGILRGRFTFQGKAWRWRAIHYTSYAAFVFGVWHGLLGGRQGKPYVDWSYGFVVAVVAVALAVRIFANSLRPRENLSAPPVDTTASSASAPMRAAAMFAQLGAARGDVGRGRRMVQSTAQPVLSAPAAGDGAGFSVRAALPSVATPPGGAGGRQPYYEPGYEGPVRYLGAPSAGTGPMPRTATGPMSRAATGPQPRNATGPMPRAATGPMPRAATGPQPRAATGPMPRAATGPQPRAGTGPMSRAATGPRPRAATGPMPRAATGPIPRGATGPQPRNATGPMPRAATGPQPRAATGPVPRAGTGPMSRAATGPQPRAATGPVPRAGTGPMSRAATGPQPRPATGPVPRPGGADPYGGRPGQGGQPGADRNERPMRPAQPPWDGNLPGPDPGFRYREPGPGMPGYRGSREHRYGGDRR